MPEASNQGAERKSAASFAKSADEGKAASQKSPRDARLLRHADFERVYKQGRRHFSGLMTVFYLSRGEGSHKLRSAATAGLRVGFTVSRALGGAVDRNRMKRRLREAVRLSNPPLEIAADVVINPKKQLLAADFSSVMSEVARAFTVIAQKVARPAERVTRENPRAEGESI
ncbi:MAG TPA: ribonuclease P protein component [Candidatus Binatia bacterium]|nr:ribonuclease P protein component [Candidatus Binatia bacterium]